MLSCSGQREFCEAEWEKKQDRRTEQMTDNHHQHLLYARHSFLLIVPLVLERKSQYRETVEVVELSTWTPVHHVDLLMCSVLGQVLHINLFNCKNETQANNN